MNDVLVRILARTRERLRQEQAEVPLERLQAMPAPAERRSFAAALGEPGRFGVVAEFKRHSPSRGLIRADLAPAAVAQAYEAAGAVALSVLTEPEFFGGSLDDLRAARQATLLPVLRKDFVVDAYQIWQARAAGADAVLLIVAALQVGDLSALLRTASLAGLDALVEVHDAVELSRALRAGARIVGVNNRNLRTLEVSLETGLRLAELIPDDVIAVAESGIRTPHDLHRLRAAGYDAFLIGEHLMSQPDPGLALQSLRRRAILCERRVAVKVCGITNVEDALLAAGMGADALGFVFWQGSPRAVDPATVRRIGLALPPLVQRVGVFVDATEQEVARVVEEARLDVVQLHGEEPPERFARLPRRGLKAIRVGPGFRPEHALRYAGAAAGILLDARVEGAPGGTGQSFDWSLARGVREHAPYLMLAGGLRPENVAAAVAAVQPDAVDVSSGVELAPGRKDPIKLRAFMDAVRAAAR